MFQPHNFSNELNRKVGDECKMTRLFKKKKKRLSVVHIRERILYILNAYFMYLYSVSHEVVANVSA